MNVNKYFFGLKLIAYSIFFSFWANSIVPSLAFAERPISSSGEDFLRQVKIVQDVRAIQSVAMGTTLKPGAEAEQDVQGDAADEADRYPAQAEIVLAEQEMEFLVKLQWNF